jgi:hypothetical protein
MNGTQEQRLGIRCRHSPLAAVLILAGCSPTLLSDPSPPPEPAYRANVASYFRGSFKGMKPSATEASPYSEFEISGARWIHARTGWNWLVCARFKEKGNDRTYAFYIKEKPASEVPPPAPPPSVPPQKTPAGNKNQKAGAVVDEPPPPLPDNPLITIVEARYAVQTDECETQSYQPLDVATGAIGSASTFSSPVITAEPPPPPLQAIH